ncbi:MAG: hypothetical protein DHS20C18_44670 [Saprospiraceae bacterium]|nr:MAG: hypothetical protein DHS20C18_44670 [Saprospiraceae bacterium]
MGFLFRLVAIVFIFISSTSLKAAHIIGGEITYVCLGYTNGDPASNSRTYQFTMRIYRDCQGQGAAFDSAPGGSFDATVSIWTESGTDAYLNLVLGAPEITFIDPNPGNPCLIVPNNVCVQEGVYTFPLVELPIINESYFIAYQRCCRNNTITNIINPGGTGATYFMDLLPKAQEECNSGPVFNNFPPIVLCANEEFVVDHSATDPEGDQLVYEFCSPFVGGGANFGPQATSYIGVAPDPDAPPPYDAVGFLAPNYTALQPLGAGSELSINPFTGVITGVPANVGQFVVGVCVSEYRNGVLLSQVRRDFQFNVTTCEATVVADVEEDLIVNEDRYVINSCGDTEITFINESFQQQYIDVFRWEFMINNATQIIETWDATVTFPGEGQYEGRLVLNPGSECGDTAEIRINIYPDLEADYDFEYDTCVAGPVQFFDRSVTSSTIESWSWDFYDGLAGSSNQHPAYRFSEPGEKTVLLRVTDENECVSEKIQNISYFPSPALIVVSPSSFEGCPPAEIYFNNLSEPINTDYETIWDFGDGEGSLDLSPTHTFNKEGVFSVSLEIISPIGCVTDTIFEDLIIIEPAPVADFSFTPDKADNFNPEFSFTDESIGADRWFWDFGGFGTSILPNPVFAFPDTGFHKVGLIVTHVNGCQDSLSRQLDVEPKVTFFLPNAFTPNDDSVNDLFKGEGFLRGHKQFRMVIWNRWGELVFETTNYQDAWNGTKDNNGRRVPAGVYMYLVQMTGPRGDYQEIKGFATVIR